MEVNRTRLALLGSLAAMALALLGPGTARASLPPQGIYEQCAPNSTTLDCGQRLHTIAKAGFKYVLNYTAWFGSAQQVRAYADRAAASGIKLIWPLNDKAWRDGTDLVDHYRYLGPDCGCDSNPEFKQFALGIVKDHPATWGFYVGDEQLPTAQNVSDVTALSAEVGQIAPGKPTMFVQLPRDDLAAGLEPFLPAVDVGATDYYPVGLEPGLNRFPGIAAGNRASNAKYGTQAAMVLQAFSWAQYYPTVYPDAPFPTRAEMQKMRDLAISHGEPGMLFWYSYNDVLESADPDGGWADVREAAFAPHIRVRGVPSGCAGRRVKLGVKVSANSKLLQVRLLVDGELVRRTASPRTGISLRGLSRGTHRVRVVARDRSGNKAKASQRLKRC